MTESINYSDFKFIELKEILNRLGLEAKGNKSTLISLLRENEDSMKSELLKIKTSKDLQKIDSISINNTSVNELDVTQKDSENNKTECITSLKKHIKVLERENERLMQELKVLKKELLLKFKKGAEIKDDNNILTDNCNKSTTSSTDEEPVKTTNSTNDEEPVKTAHSGQSVNILTKDATVPVPTSEAADTVNEEVSVCPLPTAQATQTTQATDEISNGTHQNKILILADSHGRNMGNLMSTKSNYSVLNFFKPNGKLNDIINNVPKLTKNFTTNDYVILIGGTNDFPCQNLKQLTLIYLNLVKSLLNTNIILTAIPYNYKNVQLNYDINAINKFLYKLCLNNKNTYFFNTNLIISKIYYSRDKVHINYHGKIILVQRILKLIKTLTAKRNMKMKIPTIATNSEKKYCKENDFFVHTQALGREQ